MKILDVQNPGAEVVTREGGHTHLHSTENSTAPLSVRERLSRWIAEVQKSISFEFGHTHCRTNDAECTLMAELDFLAGLVDEIEPAVRAMHEHFATSRGDWRKFNNVLEPNLAGPLTPHVSRLQQRFRGTHRSGMYQNDFGDVAKAQIRELDKVAELLRRIEDRASDIDKSGGLGGRNTQENRLSRYTTQFREAKMRIEALQVVMMAV